MTDTGSSSTTVVDALCRWAEARFGGPVSPASPPEPNGDGFDSAIWFVHLDGDALPDAWRLPLVVRVKPDPDRADVSRLEADVHDWLAHRDFPVPRMLAVIEAGVVAEGPVQVMARAPGRMMLDAVLSAPWTAGAHVRRLADAHARIHELDPSGFPADGDLLDKRLRLARTVSDAVGDDGIRRGIGDVMTLAPDLRDAPPVVCHGDYHPLNVLVDGEVVTVIDWTDAGLGDRHGDVARTLVLFGIAAIAASSAGERVALRAAGPVLGRRYRRHYGRHHRLDPHRLALWTPLHLLHGWSQAVGVAEGVFGDPARDGPYPALAAELRRRFETALARVT